MAALTLAQQAATAAAQGQQLISQDQSTAAGSQADYNNYSNQANQASQQEQAEAQYMQGAGSGANQFNTAQQAQFQQEGYDPQQMVDANKSLFAINGALNAANAQFNTPGGVGMYGVSAPAMASYESSMLTPLQTGLGEANANLGQLNSEYNNANTAAGISTTNQVQSEQNSATALSQAATQFQGQAAAALQNMQFYNQLASTQGNLNSEEQASYGQAEQAYATAQNMLAEIQQYNTQSSLNTAQAGYYNSQVLKTPAASASSASKPLSVGVANPGSLSVGSSNGGSVLQGAVSPQSGGGIRLQ